MSAVLVDLACQVNHANSATADSHVGFQPSLTRWWIAIREIAIPARNAMSTAWLMFVITACTHMAQKPDTLTSDDVPVAWSVVDATAASEHSSLVNWWARFNDPILSRLIADALLSNTSIMGAKAALRQARALREGVAAALFPTVAASATVERSSSTSGVSPATGRTSINSFQIGLDANWELDIFGANREALKASDAALRASAASLGDVQVSIAAEVALAYITLRNAQARLSIANENLVSQRQTLQITQWRQEAGLGTSIEVEQARADSEQTAALLPSLQTSIEQASHALAVLVGKPPAALTVLLQSAAPLPLVGTEIIMRMPAETLRQRADVTASEHQVEAAHARVSQAEAARLPNFSIGGSLGLNALTLGALTHGSSVVSTLLAGVSLPVFDGGAARAQIDAQQAALEQAQSAYRAVVLQALIEVEDALVAMRGDRLRLKNLNSAADAATNAALMARQRYSSGLVDFQIVLQTQRVQLSTQDSVASARADVSSDRVRLYKALGGGWEPDTNNNQASTQ